MEDDLMTMSRALLAVDMVSIIIGIGLICYATPLKSKNNNLYLYLNLNTIHKINYIIYLGVWLIVCGSVSIYILRCIYAYKNKIIILKEN